MPAEYTVPERELHFDFIRSSGPGGQNVNKVSTAVQLRFDVGQSPSLPPAVKQRLRVLAGSRMTLAGELIITARRFRSQDSNRHDAVQRLTELVRQAAVPPPPPRKTTRPSRRNRFKRLEEKRHHSEVKAGRGMFRRDAEP
jgi:ribosome-associated protein